MADTKETKSSGKTYDLSVKTEVEGKSKWQGLGMVYIRDNGSGGAIFMKKEAFLAANLVADYKGQVVISLFPHRPRPANGAAKTETKAA